MGKRVVVATGVTPLFDLVSHGRGGPADPSRLSPAQVQAIARTVQRVPEVMVKVSGGGRDVRGVQAHLRYIDRHGKLPVHLDDGQELTGKGVAAELAVAWNLDLSRGQYRAAPAPGQSDRRPKLVHNIVLSMPGRTPSGAVLAAARVFAREQFGAGHRYAMVLHTDQAHPHVHLVVKAEHEFEPGRRLAIRKATLRQWREAFAEALRAQGVAANATPRQVRGVDRLALKDPIHQRLRALGAYARLSLDEQAGRPAPAGSSVMRRKVDAVARAWRDGRVEDMCVSSRQAMTREVVRARWQATAQVLQGQGQGPLAEAVAQFAQALPTAQSDQALLARRWQAQLTRQRARPAPAPTAPAVSRRGPVDHGR